MLHLVQKDEIMKVAKEIRGFLADEFPNAPDLEKQCKRASIMLDLYFKKKKIKANMTAGFITKDGDVNDFNRGHVWNIIELDGVAYLLDITLTQFKGYLQTEIPDVVFLPYQEAKKMYSYKADGKGKYRYHRDDVRTSLLLKLEKLN